MTGEDPADASSERRRWRRAVVDAGRWLRDVFRGHAWSRHLDHPEEK